MASRHAIALESQNTTDLALLAEMMVIAAREVQAEQKMPCNDVAVRLICFQIAFAGNGDIPFYQYYIDAYEFCEKTVIQDQLGFPTKDKPNEPVHQAS